MILKILHWKVVADIPLGLILLLAWVLWAVATGSYDQDPSSIPW